MLPVNRRYCIILFVMKTIPKHNEQKKKRRKKVKKRTKKNKQLSRDAQNKSGKGSNKAGLKVAVFYNKIRCIDNSIRSTLNFVFVKANKNQMKNNTK